MEDLSKMVTYLMQVTQTIKLLHELIGVSRFLER